MSIKDGGPAYPQPDLSGYGMGPRTDENEMYEMSGMTLRDWFAGQALASMAFGMMQAGYDEQHPPAVVYGGIARSAFSLADAMLAERSKP